MGIADWIILGIVMIAIAAALLYMRRHKSRCLECGGDCARCGEQSGQASAPTCTRPR